MEYTQQILYDISLPQFLIVFKNNCLDLIVPQMNAAIHYLQSPQVNHSYSFLLILFLAFFLLKGMFSFLVGDRTHTSEQRKSQMNESFKQMKNQIWNMKKTVRKLMEWSSVSNQKLSDPKSKKERQFQAIDQLIGSYRKLVEQNQSMYEFILDSHEQLTNEFKKIKRKKNHYDRTPSNASFSDYSVEPKIEEFQSSSKEIIYEVEKEMDTEQTNSEAKQMKLPVNGKVPVRSSGRKNVPPPPVRKF